MKMMELLKKFEEENQQTSEMGSDEEDGEDLARRFKEIDLNAASSADLWSKLTVAEQAEFLKVMEDPNSDLAQQLLASVELENERRDPWWDAPLAEAEDSTFDTSHRYGSKPEMIHIPAAMVKPIPNGPALIYNICAVCIAYSFVTRHLSISPLSSLKSENIDLHEAKHFFSQLVPFLVDHRSKTLYRSLSNVVTDIWSRFKPKQVDSRLFSVLLKDTACLTRPSAVTTFQAAAQPCDEEYDTVSHPHSNIVLALSDLTTLFSDPSAGGKKTHVSHKLFFYAVHILSTPTAILRAIADELTAHSDTYLLRAEDDAALASFGTGFAQREHPRNRVPVIEEI
ncbi:hypothetical protein DXG01_000951 [Tephrocybe rancida]|nr:hypothetical protein DXG01_000951 [Tephrocybe rancida]